MKTRVCFECNSNKTYVDLNGWKQWYKDPRNPSRYLCSKCYTRLCKNPKHNPIWNPISSKRYIAFRQRRIYLGMNPRIGVCNWCRAVLPFDTPKTLLHHEAYHEEDPLRDTIEICAKCHRKTY